ncbi:MAG TPA: SDR family NAD(P)-dependent oxidoreductase, partial [Trebonia sp.]
EGSDLTALAGVLAVDGQRPFREVLPVLAAWRRRERDATAVADWRYQVSWAPVPDPGPAALSGAWLLVVPDATVTGNRAPGDSADSATADRDAAAGGTPDRDTRAGVIAAALTARGAEVTVVTVGAVRPAVPAAGLAGVVSLLALDETPLPGLAAVPSGLAATVTLIQALGEAGTAAPLWVLTQGAVGAVAGQSPGHPGQAPVWGLGRVAALEYPDRWGGLVDLPPRLDERAAGRLAALLSGASGEDQLALRPSGILGRRLTRAPGKHHPGKHRWTPRGSVLVTGGTGSIAGHVARWLASRAAPRVILISRSGPAAPGTARLAAELAQAGTAVQVAVCDATSREQLATVLDGADRRSPVTAVFHTAGVSQSVPLSDTTPDTLAAVLAAKAAGARLLDELTAGRPLDAFVLFSSGSAAWGSGLQGGYAAANAYLDALADHRRGRGLAATSIAWGMWAGGGMADEQAAAELKRRGLAAMDPGRAVAALAQVLDAGEQAGAGPASTGAGLTVADIDWARFAPAFTVRRPSPLLAALPEAAAALDSAAAGHGSGDRDSAGNALARQLATLTRADAEQRLADLVQGEAAAVLGHSSSDAVEPGRAFKDLGFDSLTALELRNRVTAATGLKLPSTLVYDHPSPAALAAHLAGQLLADTGPAPAGPAPAGAETPVSAAAAAAEPIAIVGMSCRFPGGADSPEKLWELLAGGVDTVTGFPTGRGWDNDALYNSDPDQAGTTYVRQGAFLHDAGEFDPGFFGISPREALAMDPQQRLLLEVSWEALERAGIDPKSLHGTATGVFAGAYASGYGLDLHLTGTGTSEQEAGLTTGGATAVISGRVSYTLGLEGPAVTVDTACSSSLVALHLASQALRSGECTLALAGGVTVMGVPWELVAMGKTKVLAADGRCKAFADAADGMGLAEGAGMLVVERLSDARRHGHPVLAVVRASAVNQDGASNGLAAPSGRAQQRVIKSALSAAGLTPADVDAVEAHGTGTRLGDPIEAHAVLAAYGQGRPDGRPLWLGSVKSNIGHTQCAAGVAGVMKMVLAIQHRELPRTLHAGRRSDEIDWSAGDVALLTEPQPWPAGERTRRAGVSSFGVSGTNAHVILEEPEAGEPAPARAVVPATAAGEPAEPAAWLLSGRSSAGLRAQAARLAEWAAAHPEATPADVGWSLATRRSAFEHRAVVLGPTAADLTAGLHALAEGRATRSVVTGTAAATGPGKVAFVFPGQGAQWTGMGLELQATNPVFA